MDFLWRRYQHSAISQQTKRVATMDMNNKKIKRFWTGSDTFFSIIPHSIAIYKIKKEPWKTKVLSGDYEKEKF